jgi:hypothetical protein
MRAMKMAKTVRVIASAALLTLTACPREAHLKVSGNRDDLTFLFSEDENGRVPLPSDYLYIRECYSRSKGVDPRVVWRVEGPERVELSKVRYGETPNGFRTTFSAQLLVPGCYNIETSENSFNFVVETDGSIHLPKP